MLLLSFFLSASMCLAQSDCKVLKEGIDTSYEGECKKGLAHGDGVATGTDTYEGSFRKGLPHGHGKYIYATGDFYEGQWSKGLMNGDGKLVRRLAEGDSTQVGVWEDGIYLGAEKLPAYRVKYNNGVVRYNMNRLGDGNKVEFRFFQNGTPNADIQNVMYNVSSGDKINVSGVYGVNQVEFPFTCRITYKTWNKLRSVQYDAVLEFIINEPGNWQVTLNN